MKLDPRLEAIMFDCSQSFFSKPHVCPSMYSSFENTLLSNKLFIKIFIDMFEVRGF